MELGADSLNAGCNMHNSITHLVTELNKTNKQKCSSKVM